MELEKEKSKGDIMGNDSTSMESISSPEA